MNVPVMRFSCLDSPCVFSYFDAQPSLKTSATIVLVFVLSGVLGYLIGSIPTAFLVVKWKSSVDIRKAGSGNVGALNSFQVTQSKFVGAGVLVLDLLKGSGVVLLTAILFGDQFSIQATGGIAAVAGHNFPIWLKFKGGRGLAAAAGVMLVIAWVTVLVWGVLWGIGFAITRHINASNTIASVLEMLAFLVFPEALMLLITGGMQPVEEFRIFALVLFSIILIKHGEPMLEYLGFRTERNK